MRLRWPVTLAGAVGAMVAGIGGNVADAPAVSGIGWAAVAGVALSLMMDGWGLRLTGALIVALGVLGGVLAALSSPWFIAAFLLVAAAGGVMAIRGPFWATTRRSQRPSDDLWRRMGAGDDPTLS